MAIYCFSLETLMECMPHDVVEVEDPSGWSAGMSTIEPFVVFTTNNCERNSGGLLTIWYRSMHLSASSPPPLPSLVSHSLPHMQPRPCHAHYYTTLSVFMLTAELTTLKRNGLNFCYIPCYTWSPPPRLLR